MATLIFRAHGIAALVCAAMMTLSAPLVASAQEGERPGLLDRIFSGSERFGSAERPPAPAVVDRTGTVAPAGSDVTLRVDRLEAQIRQLTGVVEQLQYRNQQLEGMVRRMQDGGASATPSASAAPHPRPAAAGSPVPGRRGDAFDPALQPQAPGAPQTLGAVAAVGGGVPIGAADAGMGAPSGRGAGPLDIATMPPAAAAPGSRAPQGSGAVAATQPPTQTPRDEFDLGYGYVLHKDYALAEDTFRSFLSKYPNDRLTADATFWFGESLFQRQRFRDAAEAFLNVSTKYESNPRAPDALLRLGQSLAALGEREAACASLGEVLRKFPRASAGLRQNVEREQKRVRC
ncbi:MAG: tol-pal system protein YbgF [Xanthobacteraceae bacterium]